MKKTLGVIALIAAISFAVSCGGGGGGGNGGGPTIVPPGGGGPAADEPVLTPIEMAAIPEGSFWMGSPTAEPNRNVSYEKQYEVELTTGFKMGKYQVTQKQWEEVMGEADARLAQVKGGSYGVGDDWTLPQKVYTVKRLLLNNTH